MGYTFDTLGVHFRVQLGSSPPPPMHLCSEYEEKRMEVWVWRELRHRQNRAEKKAAGDGPRPQPTIESRDVVAAFPGTPASVVRQLLTERCHCTAQRVGDGQGTGRWRASGGQVADR